MLGNDLTGYVKTGLCQLVADLGQGAVPLRHLQDGIDKVQVGEKQKQAETDTEHDHDPQGAPDPPRFRSTQQISQPDNKQGEQFCHPPHAKRPPGPPVRHGRIEKQLHQERCAEAKGQPPRLY